MLHAPLTVTKLRVWTKLGCSPEELDAAEQELRDKGRIMDCPTPPGHHYILMHSGDCVVLDAD